MTVSPPAASTTPHALRVVARFHDLEVEETFAPAGQPLQIGHSDALAVPVPAGSPYIARCTWHSPLMVEVIDGLGRRWRVTPDSPVVLDVGPVSLELSLNPRYLLTRTGDGRWWEAMPWLSVVLAASLLVGQGGLVSQYRCEWFGGIHPGVDQVLQCVAQDQNSDGGVAGTQIAEYLARLLEEDYAGEDYGIIDEIDREQAEAARDDYYLPAGQSGPTDAMGGAEDVGPEEIRTPAAEEEAIAEAAPPEPVQEEPLVLEEPSELAPPEPEPEPVVDKGDDGIAAAEPTEVESDDEEDVTPPEEDREGWGVQDWYDEADQRLEQREIELMTEYAHQRLRIDPNDPEALSILSYYQYLDEDYDAALATYDTYIAQLPEDSAGYNNKALVYKRLGDYQTEERLYRIALAFSPDDVTALNNLAVCLSHQGRHAEALDIMQRLETLDPDDPYAELHRAKIYAEMGEKEQVYVYLERALERMAELDTLHHIEFRQDIRLDPSFEQMRRDAQFRAILVRYYGEETPLK